MTTHWSGPSPLWKSLPMVGRAIPTTVASIIATPDPRVVAATTHLPGALEKASSPAC